MASEWGQLSSWPSSRTTPNLATKTIPTKIAWLKHSGKFPMDMRMPSLEFRILPESSPLKSRILVRRLAVRDFIQGLQAKLNQILIALMLLLCVFTSVYAILFMFIFIIVLFCTTGPAGQAAFMVLPASSCGTRFTLALTTRTLIHML